MLMALGMFVFETRSVPYQQLQRATEWRHASQSRVGDRPAYQFVGPGADTITLSSTLLPEFTGGRLDLDDIRDMADQGKAWPLVEGTGRQYGLWVITKVDETSSVLFRDGAADMRNLLPGKRSQSWHGVTIAEIIDTIAKRHDLTPVIGETLAGIRIGHIDQTDESDLNFITRLGQRFDAIAAVKSERMLFTLAGEALTASGFALPRVSLTRRDGDQHRYSRTDRDSYTGVRAYWNDTAGSQRQAAIAGTGEKLKDLRDTYATEADALDAAKAELRRIQRGKATFALILAHGRVDLMPETPLTLTGWKADIDGAEWLITEVEDSLDDSGYLTRVKCEMKTNV